MARVLRSPEWFELVVAGDLAGVDRLLLEGVDPTAERELDDSWYDAIERSWRPRSATTPARPGAAEPEISDRLQLGERVSALDLAIVLEHGHIVRRLVERLGDRAAVCEDPRRTPPLVLASACGALEAVELLLAAGAEPGAGRDRDALAAAASRGTADVLRALLAAGARPDEADEDGFTPLMWAAREGHPEAVRCLLEAGADPRVSAHGDTPLLLAARGGHRDVYQLLEPRVSESERALAAPALAAAIQRAGERDELGESLVEAVCNEPDVEVERLLAKGAPVDYVATDIGKSALLCAAMHGRTKVLEALLQAGADVSMRCRSHDSERGRTALAFAVQATRFRVRMIQRLLAVGADPDAADASGKTPLRLAVDRGHEDAVLVLLEAGADPGLADEEGRTPVRAAAFKPKTLRDALARAQAAKPGTNPRA